MCKKVVIQFSRGSAQSTRPVGKMEMSLIASGNNHSSKKKFAIFLQFYAIFQKKLHLFAFLHWPFAARKQLHSQLKAELTQMLLY